jgi:DNA-directed RNA polymerase specialized sigma24 family protein
MARYHPRVTEETALGGPQAAFAETLWTTVLRAKDDGAALGRLIERNWKPLYFYIRRKGRDVEQAKDLTQAFFTHLLEIRLLDRVERGRGRFRSYLVAALEHFLANDYRSARAEKRGGAVATLALDFGGAEREFEPALADTPEDHYLRSWAAGVLKDSLQALKAEMGGRFDAVRPHLSADGDRPTYRDSAAAAGMTEFDFTNFLRRARLRLRGLIVERVRDTVDGDAADEVAELLNAFRKKP